MYENCMVLVERLKRCKNGNFFLRSRSGRTRSALKNVSLRSVLAPRSRSKARKQRSKAHQKRSKTHQKRSKTHQKRSKGTQKRSQDKKELKMGVRMPTHRTKRSLKWESGCRKRGKRAGQKHAKAKARHPGALGPMPFAPQ